jgi:hypothetical protein
LQVSYTSKLPFTTGLEDQNLGLKKELLAVQITTTLIRDYLALLGVQPGFEEDVLFEVQLVHPDAPGTQHHQYPVLPYPSVNSPSDVAEKAYL